MSKSDHQSGVIVAGLALFSMFFGAGDLIWPLILGGESGSQNFYAMLGLLITGVSLPLLGLVSMMLFEGNYRAFFERLGKMPALFVIFIVQLILGPVGSIPRLLTLSFATIKPYLPEDFTFISFCIAASVMILAFTIRPRRIIDVLGLVLTPMLLLSLGAILVIGFWNLPELNPVALSGTEAFSNGLKVCSACSFPFYCKSLYGQC